MQDLCWNVRDLIKIEEAFAEDGGDAPWLKDSARQRVARPKGTLRIKGGGGNRWIS